MSVSRFARGGAGRTKEFSGEKRSMWIRRSKGKLLLFDLDSGEHERLVDLRGKSIVAGDWQRGSERRSSSHWKEKGGKEAGFGLEVRRNPFEVMPDDVELVFDSLAEASMWQRRLIRGVVYHVKSDGIKTSKPMPPTLSRVSSVGSVSSQAHVADEGGSVRDRARGLTPAEVANVGRTFTFVSKKKKAVKQEASGLSLSEVAVSVAADHEDDGAGVGVLETLRRGGGAEVAQDPSTGRNMVKK